MPDITNSERIRELEKSVASQNTQLETTNKALDSLERGHQGTVHKLEEARRELEKKIVVLEEKVSKLEAGQSEQKILVLEEKVSKLEGSQIKVADRLWAFLSLVLAGGIGSVLTWLLTRKSP